MTKIVERLAVEKNIALSLSDSVMNALRLAAIKNLGNGGRGIGNIVESMLINPLSRYIFDNELFTDCKIEIIRINENDKPCSLECKILD